MLRVVLLVIVPSVAFAEPSGSARISIAPSYARVSSSSSSKPMFSELQFMNSGHLTGNGGGGQLELARTWKLGGVWIGPVLRFGRQWVNTAAQHFDGPVIEKTETVTYAHLAPQLTLPFDRYYIRVDAGFAHIFDATGGALPARNVLFEAGIEIGISHSFRTRTTGQFGLGAWTTWARQEEEGDTSLHRYRGHMIALGLNWSVDFPR